MRPLSSAPGVSCTPCPLPYATKNRKLIRGSSSIIAPGAIDCIANDTHGVRLFGLRERPLFVQEILCRIRTANDFPVVVPTWEIDQQGRRSQLPHCQPSPLLRGGFSTLMLRRYMEGGLAVLSILELLSSLFRSVRLPVVTSLRLSL